MSKIDSPELRGLPQELIDWSDSVNENINFGKIQLQVLSARPTYVGRRGEMVFFQDSTGVGLFMMSSDQSTIWTELARKSF